MNLRNLTIKGYEWFADVWADELLASDIRSLGLAGTEYEEVKVQGDFYISGPNSAEPTAKVSSEVTVESANGKWIHRRLMASEVKEVRTYVERCGDRHEWVFDAHEAKGDEA